MFDDMITTAGTVVEAAKVARERGATSVHVACTHAVMVGQAIERLAATEKLLAQAHVPAVAGELHVALAEAIFFYRLPGAQALPHLLAAERLGGTDRVGRADVLVQIAELSRLAGNRAQAAKYYRQFLQENPRDSANYTARRRLADMEAPPAAAPGGR